MTRRVAHYLDATHRSGARVKFDRRLRGDPPTVVDVPHVNDAAPPGLKMRTSPQHAAIGEIRPKRSIGEVAMCPLTQLHIMQ